MEEIKIRERNDTLKNEEIDKLAADTDRFWQVDFLKVWMIALVIMDHSVPHEVLRSIALYASQAAYLYPMISVVISRLLSTTLWERIAIPVFMIVLGFNWTKSLQKQKDQSLKALYSWKKYFVPKIKRFLVPFAVIYGLSIIYWFFVNVVFGGSFLIPDPVDMRNPWLKLSLMLPIWGPGNWFIPMLILTILLFPLLYRLFTIKKWSSWIALLVCYIIEIVYQLAIRMFYIATRDPVLGYDFRLNLFTFTPLMMLTAIGLGIWIGIDHRLFSGRNILIIWILGLTSLGLIFYYGHGWIFFSLFDYNLFVYPYSALLVLILINIFPKSPHGRGARFITMLSKSTYHILMTQIFYFSLVYGLIFPFDEVFGYSFAYLWYYPVNLVITFTIGALWSTIENRYRGIDKKVKSRIDSKRLEMMKARGWLKEE